MKKQILFACVIFALAFNAGRVMEYAQSIHVAAPVSKVSATPADPGDVWIAYALERY